MTEPTLVTMVGLPMLFGLLGFIEPCSIGTTLVVVKRIEGLGATGKLVQVMAFALTRALLIGSLGIVAGLLGTAFLGLQKAAWFVLGVLYVALGVLYLTGHIAIVARSIGSSLTRAGSVRGSIALGVLFGANIPACAAPLVLALVGAAAANAASGATLFSGFISLAVFGLALSLPLVLAVVFAPARRALDWLGGLSRRIPVWIGVLLIALGAWSIWFALFVTLHT